MVRSLWTSVALKTRCLVNIVYFVSNGMNTAYVLPSVLILFLFPAAMAIQLPSPRHLDCWRGDPGQSTALQACIPLQEPADLGLHTTASPLDRIIESLFYTTTQRQSPVPA